MSRTQPSPLCFASRTSSFAPSHPPRRPRPRGRRATYALHCRRCVRRAASWHRGSNFVSPPGLRHARIPPEPPISKSGLIDPEFEYPGVVFKIERAKCQVGAPSQSSMTKRSFQHGFEFCTEWCRPSCSTWKLKQFDFFSTVWASGRRRGRGACRRLWQAICLARSSHRIRS